MSGSRRVARLAFYWALIGCGIAPAAAAQEATLSASQSKKQVAAPSTVQSAHPMWNGSDRAPSANSRSVSPWLPQPWRSAEAVPSNKLNLSDQHIIAVSTLTLILIGVIVILLAT